MMRSPLNGWPRATMAALGCAAALAACSTATSGGTGTQTNAAHPGNGPLALAKCMRANGVSNFPDPTSGPGGEGLSIDARPGSDSLTVNGVTLSGPAFQAARKACARYLPPSGSGPAISAAQRTKLLQFSECMRAHGIPNFPDPTFPKGGGAEIGGVGSGIDPSAPAFQQANRRCGGPGGPRIGKVRG